MAKRKDTEAPAVAKTAAETAAPETTANLAAPLTVEMPKIEAAAEAPKIEADKIVSNVELPKIEAQAIELPKAEPIKVDTMQIDSVKIEQPAEMPFAAKPQDDEIKIKIEPEIAAAAMQAQASTSGRSHRFAMLAASVAMAAAIGAIVGAAATAGIWQTSTAATDSTAAETRALRETVVRVSSELTQLKSHIDAGNRSATTQLQQLGQRIDRTEKAQAEPTAKLAKIMEALDRLERRAGAPLTNASLTQPQPMLQQQPQVQGPTLAAASPDVTGSVNSQNKAIVVEGWVLRDFYAGRAILENRVTGALYEVGPGSNLPGVGRVETIKREDNRVIVVTARGIITSALEPPRRRAILPYR